MKNLGLMKLPLMKICSCLKLVKIDKGIDKMKFGIRFVVEKNKLSIEKLKGGFFSIWIFPPREREREREKSPNKEYGLKREKNRRAEQRLSLYLLVWLGGIRDVNMCDLISFHRQSITRCFSRERETAATRKLWETCFFFFGFWYFVLLYFDLIRKMKNLPYGCSFVVWKVKIDC